MKKPKKTTKVYARLIGGTYGCFCPCVKWYMILASYETFKKKVDIILLELFYFDSLHLLISYSWTYI